MTHAKAIVIGSSAGALEALSGILPTLPASFPLPIFIVVHVPSHKPSLLAELLQSKCAITVREAEDKLPIKAGTAYIAPPDYHLLVEEDDYLSLSNEEEILFSRPSIDALFESAADVYGENLVGIVLSGANSDGAKGLKAIAVAGGTALVQQPETAYAKAMPEAALAACASAKAMSLSDINHFLASL